MTTIFHSQNARSLRVLWVLEEIGAKAEVKTLPFPPRKLQPEYLALNPSGTVPLMIDGERVMTESLAICEYLVTRHGNTSLVVPPNDPERAPYLQWLWYGESTIMLPIGMIARVERLKAPGPASEAIMADARETLAARLNLLEQRLDGRDFLVAGRLTLADVSVGYAIHVGTVLFGLGHLFGPRARAYFERLRSRPAYRRAEAVG
ncbi:MAG TPA: glutathione S-transferase family protein [Reyranella sp.]|nr:glutathione S-transferase family protein [Reyranella sp.]